MVEIRIAADVAKLRKQLIESPTVAQAKEMAQVRQEWLAQARELVEGGRQEDRSVAVNLDIAAWEIEIFLLKYGFDSETGQRRK